MSLSKGVSTVTRARSRFFKAPVSQAMRRVSANNISSRSPIRLRQWLIPERSCGRVCWKNSSPVKYWKYGSLTHRSQTCSSARLKVSFNKNMPTMKRTGSAGRPSAEKQSASSSSSQFQSILSGKNNQRVLHIDDLVKPGAEKIIVIRLFDASSGALKPPDVRLQLNHKLHKK